MKRVFLLLGLFSVATLSIGQLATNRMRAHYRITAEKLATIEEQGFHLSLIQAKPEKGEPKPIPVRYSLGDLSTFKFLATLKEGVILLDPWSFNRTDVNMDRPDEPKSGYTLSYLSKHTKPTLQIDLKRDSLGESTQVVKLPYRAVVVTVNTLGIKVRPSATDSAGKNYATNTYSGFNLGISLGYSLGGTAFTHRTQITTSHTFSGGIGFSAIGLAKEPLYDKVTVDASHNNFVLSLNLSYTIARNDIGLMLAAGMDIMAGAHADSWLYQRRFFWGFGVAIGLKV